MKAESISRCRLSGKSGVGPGRMAAFEESTFTAGTGKHGVLPSWNRHADTSGNAFPFPGHRLDGAQPGWLHWPRQGAGRSSRCRGDAMQSMRCR